MAREDFEVIVVGAGHAGIEAALASARMGVKTLCITLRLDRIGHLPCNCSIGGPAKGHMAREIDALGGKMAQTTDMALTHIRRVGTGKGPAVQTVRAHVCKELYPERMRQILTHYPNLTVCEGTVDWIDGEDAITGVQVTPSGSQTPETITCRALVLTTGTFLNGLCHEGHKRTVAARFGDKAISSLSEWLKERGIRLRRFKTGTTPRVRLSSLSLDQTVEMESEPHAGPMSFWNDQIQPKRPLLSCWQTWTNSAMHDLIREHLHESAMYGGQIEGVGPRYCPSIEDKVVRFAEKNSHPVFLEIEDWALDSVYVQGVSTSLPAEIQRRMLRQVPGMANVEMLRPGYAVEYDMADPLQLTSALMSKQIGGLFLAGQINGTSGYEEAAAQGLVAGVNAAHFAQNKEPVAFARENSFIGVMIDDLVTKGVEDPYRMLTARAEHRLLLRHDNADARLSPLAHELGLLSEPQWRRYSEKQESVQLGIEALKEHSVDPSHEPEMRNLGLQPSQQKCSLFDLMRRSDVDLQMAERVASACGFEIQIEARADVREQIELAGIYAGYIEQQRRLVDHARRLDDLKIPKAFDYLAMPGLSHESKDKLSRIRPETIGQASRVPGVRMSDVGLLIGTIRAGRSCLGDAG